MQQAMRAQPAKGKFEIYYQDYLSREWVRLHAPCRWQGNVEVKFRNIPYSRLEPAGSWKRPEVVAKWLRKLEEHQPVPPPIVCLTERGTYYVREGNHRYEAMGAFLGASAETVRIRVAMIVPKRNFRFRYRWFGIYGTYLLEPEHFVSKRGGVPLFHRRPRASKIGKKPAPSNKMTPLPGRTLVIASHPDDETACAGLLQRIREPAVVFMTDGAPAAEFFWRDYGSPNTYAAVRRAEAIRALATIGITHPHFLNNLVRCKSFHDQDLYRRLVDAIPELLRLTDAIMPDALLVPAYEGGHPDHDVCSFLGHVIGSALRLPVWEMPLYHRSSSGFLVHQQFVDRNGTEVMLAPTTAELRKQHRMVEAYASQKDLQEYLAVPVELYRPQAAYDYSRPPHPWKLNYEAWEWPMTGADVCRSFGSWLRNSDFLPRIQSACCPPLERRWVNIKASKKSATAVGRETSIRLQTAVPRLRRKRRMALPIAFQPSQVLSPSNNENADNPTESGQRCSLLRNG